MSITPIVIPVDAKTADWPRKVATFLNRLQNTTAAAGVTATWGSITGTLAAQTDLNTALSGKQPLDGDLTALAALSGTNTIYYRSGSSTWSAVTVGAGLSFSGGSLSASGGGTVTSVSVVTANGVSGSVATATTTPAITLTLGAITPSSVAASGTVTGSNLSGTNTGDQTTISGNAGSATILATGRTIAMTGDVVWTSPSFNGSANVTAAGTIAASAVTLAKIANAAANSKLLGSGASGSGAAYVELTLGTNLSMSGTTLNAAGGGGGGLTTAFNPQGRLTLVTLTPVLISDQTAKTTVYYTPYIGDQIPLYSGSAWSSNTFTEKTLTLDTTNHASGSVYDVFIWSNSGSVSIGTGPAWSSTTSRGTGAGTTELQMLNGIWTNKNTITLKNGAGAGTAGVAANTATYVGTFYATANGQTGMAFKPSAASGGTNNILAVYNAYNRVLISAVNRDSAADWTYATNTWRASNNSSSNRITWVDGLQHSSVRALFSQTVYTASSTSGIARIGINLDSTSATPESNSSGGTTGGAAPQYVFSATAEYVAPPQLGLHYAQKMEISGLTTTMNFAGSSPPGNNFSLTLEM